MIVILIVTAIKEINEILINGNTEIIGKYIILGMAIFYIVFNLLMIAYIEREPLKSLKYDDRIFIWLIFLINKIEGCKGIKLSFSIKVFKIILIRNKILLRLSEIQNNLENSFIFNSNLAIDIERIRRLRDAITKILPYSIINYEYKPLAVDLLKSMVDIYSFNVMQLLLKEDNRNDYPIEVQSEKNQQLSKLDKKIDDILQMDFEVKKEERRIIKFINAYNKYLVFGSIIALGIIIFCLTIINDNVLKIISSISCIIPMCVFLYSQYNKWISKRDKFKE
jgi:hypothetical protein